jgi:hypothetical protein
MQGRRSAFILALVLVLPVGAAAQGATGAAAADNYDFNDSHFHLTNYVQEGTDINDFLRFMGNRVGRSTLFGIPLQQEWSYANSGDFAPRYYLESDAPLYYYSFTDAYIAMVYLSLPPEQRARFDPMITGFNPADMYATAHIRRVLRLFPGVFSGIGEFTIHKEFVSSKVAGGAASLRNPALDSILELAGEVGLVALIHNDVDMPFAKSGKPPVYLEDMKALLRRHPRTTIIWAHTGLGRVVAPAEAFASAPTATRSPRHVDIVEGILSDPTLSHVYFDISWDEVAKYITSSPEVLQRSSALINRYPDRFLFGTDEVAPKSETEYTELYREYAPLWALLTPQASEMVRKGNYLRLFDRARESVRNWERTHVR